MARALQSNAAAQRFLQRYADAVDVTRAVSRLVKATRAACELDDAKRSEKTEEAVAA